MKHVADHTRKEYIRILSADDKFGAIEELASVFKGSPVCTDIMQLIASLTEREKIMSTGIGFGIAIPHAKISSVHELAFAVGISRRGIEFDSMDGEPVHLIILVAAGERQHKDYLRMLSSLMSVLKNAAVKERIISSATPEEVLGILKASAPK